MQNINIEKNTEKYRNDFQGPLAQLVEHFPFKEGVVGSNPTRLTTTISTLNVDFYLILT